MRPRLLPPASAWVAAGVIGGGLGTMIVRAGFGCVYGGLGGAVASLARALVLKPELLLLDNPLGGLGARHRHWLMNFLEQLARGHDFFGGQKMTVAVTTDDLRPWRHSQRKFAVLHEGKFSVLGAWDGERFTSHAAVKDLLSAPQEFNP